MAEDKKAAKATSEKAAMEYPGVANNIADDEKVTPCLEKQSVKELNNNPRNNDM